MRQLKPYRVPTQCSKFQRSTKPEIVFEFLRGMLLLSFYWKVLVFFSKKIFSKPTDSFKFFFNIIHMKSQTIFFVNSPKHLIHHTNNRYNWMFTSGRQKINTAKRRVCCRNPLKNRKKCFSFPFIWFNTSKKVFISESNAIYISESPLSTWVAWFYF